jgi:vancomycin aglycone glucosyltransferase
MEQPMKVVLAGYGSRGDVEPCVAMGRELLRRGHDVHMAVPPNMIGFVESAGLAAISYGPDSREELNPATDLLRNVLTNVQNPISALPEIVEHVSQVRAAKTATLTSLADGADLLLAGFNERGMAANVADFHGIPLAVLHFFPERMWSGGLYSIATKATDDTQRRAMGLPEEAGPPTLLEIQAYDELCLPGPAAEWVESDSRHPFVGALSLELATDADEEVLSWIAAGTPPIYFGFGSTPIASAAETVAVISSACLQLGERALICSGPNDVTGIPQLDHVKFVEAVNHAAIFPGCRAAVHHGGAGTTAAVMRAGIPMLILWFWLDQPLWAAGVEQLEVGSGRPFSATTLDSLVADLRALLAPRYITRAREVAAALSTAAGSAAAAADHLEHAARLGRTG